MLIVLLVLIISIFLNPALSCHYVSQALTLWFEQIIPALFPFMIISGIIVRKGYSHIIAKPIYPVIGRLFRINHTMCTAMLLGFLFGFPLGAKTIAEEYQFHHITKEQAQFLLAFCNNIGPIYMLSFVIPLFHLPVTVLLLHIGIPFLYGLFLRYTRYRKLSVSTYTGNLQNMDTISAVDDAVYSACNAILKLGGYMIFFIIWNLPCSMLLSQNILSQYLPAVFEITSGLKLCSDIAPSAVMILLTFSGLSCYAQTYTCIKETDLSFKNYCLHKFVQVGISIIAYCVFFSSFST